MKRNNLALLKKCALLLVLVLALFRGASLPAAAGTYMVNGKEVSSNRFEAWLLVNTAANLMRQQRTRDAVRTLERALKFDPLLAEAHSNLGIALARIGKVEEAVEHFRMAIVDDRTLSAPRLNLASLYQATGKPVEAVATYEAFLRDFPDSKQSEAVKERIDLLNAELNNQAKAEVTTSDDYYANVISADGRRRWSNKRMPLKVYITAGDGLNGYKEQYERILKESFKEWEKASAGKVKIVFVDSLLDKPDIRCKWLDDQKELASSAEGGETQVRFAFDSIVGATIYLLVQDDQSIPFTDNLIRTLCLHETGHSLGLLGHSVSPADVLFSTAPLVEREQHLSKRDRATLNKLYSEDLNWLSEACSQADQMVGGNGERLLVLGQIAIFVFSVLTVLIFMVARSMLLKKGKRKKQKTKL